MFFFHKWSTVDGWLVGLTSMHLSEHLSSVINLPPIFLQLLTRPFIMFKTFFFTFCPLIFVALKVGGKAVSHLTPLHALGTYSYINHLYNIRFTQVHLITIQYMENTFIRFLPPPNIVFLACVMVSTTSRSSFALRLS